MRRRRGSSGVINLAPTTTATVTAADAATFVCGNVVRQSTPVFNPTQRLVGTDVKNSSAADFTVFS